MSSNDYADEVFDAYLDMIERVTLHYNRYVCDMWSVVALHTRHVLSEEDWSERIAPFKGRYDEQVEIESALYDALDMLVLGDDDVSDIRTKGLADMRDLYFLHAQLEHDLLTELLSVRTMTVQKALESCWLSEHRLDRHATLRHRLRRELDTAWFLMRETSKRGISISSRHWN